MAQDGQYHILNGLSDGVLVIDREYTIVFANQYILDLYGVKPEKIVGKNVLLPCITVWCPAKGKPSLVANVATKKSLLPALP